MEFAESLGIDRHGKWNVKSLFGHNGGHIDDYYDGIDDLIYEAFLGRNWRSMSQAEMQGVLEGVANEATKRVYWGKVPWLARLFGQPYLRLYR